MSTQRAVKHAPRSLKSAPATAAPASSDTALPGPKHAPPSSPPTGGQVVELGSVAKHKTPPPQQRSPAAGDVPGNLGPVTPKPRIEETPSSQAVNITQDVVAASATLSRPSQAADLVVKGIGEDEGNTRLFREDPSLDRRIIEGMLNDREDFMALMCKEGFAASAVLRRAAELGLSEALVRQVKGVAADLAGERPGRRSAPASLGARTCLSCDRVFLSSGPGNRLCMRCRGGDAGLAQL